MTANNDELKVRQDAFGNPITVCKCPTCGAPAEREEVDGAYDSRTHYKYVEIDNARWFKLFAMPIGEMTRCLPSWFADGNQHIVDSIKKLVHDKQAAIAHASSEDKGGEAVAYTSEDDLSWLHDDGGGVGKVDVQSRPTSGRNLPLYTSPRATAEDVRDAAAGPSFLSAEDLETLRSFHGYCEDDQDYSISADRMNRLAELGAIERVRGKKFSITAFGDYVLERCELPLKTISEWNAKYEAEFQQRMGKADAAMAEEREVGNG